MDLNTRCSTYEAIEQYRGRPLIVYATSTRSGAEYQISEDAVREFIDQIDAIDHSSEIDVMIHSFGGDALAAWKLMSILREQFEKVSVLVPYMAFSAATLFALGADEIVMHPRASLGPIDPQISIFQPDVGMRNFAYEDVGAFLRFLANDVKISEQVHISTIIEKLFSVVDPVNVGAAKRASELSSSVGERLLRLHMTDAEDKNRARKIAENLNKSFFSHSDAVSRSRAKELSLQIASEDTRLESLMWDAYKGIEDYLRLREPFNYQLEFIKHPDGVDAFVPIPAPKIPPNAPPELVQEAWRSILMQAIDNMNISPVQVDFGFILSLVESTRVASELKTSGKIQLNWNQDGSKDIVPIFTDHGWKTVSTVS